MPHEFLTEDFLKDPIMIRFIVWMLKRISPNPSLVPLKGQSKLLRLDPFEFITRSRNYLTLIRFKIMFRAHEPFRWSIITSSHSAEAST